MKALFGSAISSTLDEREMIAVPQIGEEEDSQVNHVPKSLLVSIIAPRLEETFELVRNRLDASGCDQVAGRRVVLTGGACQLHGARELAGLILDKQVRIGRPMRVKGLAEATQRPGVFDRRRAVAFRAVGARRIAATGAYRAQRDFRARWDTGCARISEFAWIPVRHRVPVRHRRSSGRRGERERNGESSHRHRGPGGQRQGGGIITAAQAWRGEIMINLSIPKDEQELKPRITVVGVGGAGGNAVNNMIRSNLDGCEFVVVQHRRAGAAAVGGAAQDPARHQRHARARRRRAARCRPRRRRGGARRDPRSDAGLQHGVHHRRHGRRHRHRCGAGHRPRRPRTGHPDRRRGHQAVPLRGRPPHAHRRSGHRRAAEVRRHADHHPEPEPVPDRQRADDLRRRLQDGRRRAALPACAASPT